MKSTLIRCDGGISPPEVTADGELDLRTSGPNQNLRIEFEGLEDSFLQRLPPVQRDLLRVASYVYGADTRIMRGTKSDVYAADWVRHLKFIIPVEAVSVWERPAVKAQLIRTLEFLTGDRYEFYFVPNATHPDHQAFIDWKAWVPLADVDSVVMFSGGADSLAATIGLLQAGKRPLLVSHRPTPPIDTRQQNLVRQLRDRFSQWRLPQVSLVVNRQDGGGRGRSEPSQRSRSFLFTSLGCACATLIGVDDLRLCDNGVISINLPRLDQSYGSMLSRSTHPKYLASVQELVRLVTGSASLKITNDLLLNTKEDVVRKIAQSGHPELLQETVSCAHTEGMTKLQPHCGVCSQCIDRRFATVAAELTEHDLPSRYRKDIFKDGLDGQEHQLQAVSYVRFAKELEDVSSASALLEAFPELYDCLTDEGSQEACEGYYDLFQRHQKMVNGVVESQLKEYLPRIRRSDLPDDCLLRMICLGTHAIDPRTAYVERLKALICANLRPAFQTVSAANERHVQDVGESVFAAASVKLARETPMLPFATVATKPDFSAKAMAGQPPLFIEFKYIKNRKQLNKIVTEITSRMTIYRKQGAWALFVVYDPSRVIVDDNKFAGDHEDGGSIWLGVAR